MTNHHLHRRGFLHLTAAGAAAAFGGHALHAARPPFKLRYILASSMYGRLKLAEILSEVAKTGAEHIDIWPEGHANQREQIEKMGHDKFAALLKQHNVKLGILTHYDLGPFRLRKELAVAEKLGASMIICGGSGPRGLKGKALKAAVAKFVEKMKPHLAAAEKHGVVIGIENHGNNLIESPDSMKYLAELAPSKHIGVALAPYHLPQDAAAIAKLIADLGDRLVHFYAWQKGMGCHKKLPKAQELLQMPGRGKLDFAPVVSALRQINYGGWTSIFMHPVPRGIPILPTAAEVTAEINRARKYLDALVPGAPSIVPASSRGKPGRPAPSDRLTLGFIGLGSMGLRHVNGFLFEDDCRLTAVCDVDAARRKVAVDTIAKHYGKRDCAQYNDYRELIARDDLDTVCIAVPDHWHSIAAIETLRAGKDVYGEKPLALTVRQGRAIVRAVHASGRVWQTGSWQRSTRHFRFACELVRNGRIGKIQRIEVGLANGTALAPQPPMPVPKGFDYERWLGPAPWRPYTEKRCHWNFRWILDYSGGQLTDSGAHDIDIAHWGMDADATGPVEVSGRGEFPPDGLWDAATKYHVECTYASGITMGVASRDRFRSGVKFIGEDGWIHVARGGRLDASPKTLLRERIGPNDIHLDSGRGDHRQGHRQNFLDCVRTRGRTIAPVEAAHRSITVAHLGNIAMLLGRKVRWDPAAEEILDDPTASRMLTRPMRSPWHD